VPGKSSAPWFPLWSEEWLFGSVGTELELEEQAVFLRLLCLANKEDGWIRANEDMGYPPERLAGLIGVPLQALNRTIEKCVKYKKLDEYENSIYRISNWDKYQLSKRWKRKISPSNNPKDVQKLNSSGKTDVGSAKADVSSGKTEPSSGKTEPIDVDVDVDIDLDGKIDTTKRKTTNSVHQDDVSKVLKGTCATKQEAEDYPTKVKRCIDSSPDINFIREVHVSHGAEYEQRVYGVTQDDIDEEKRKEYWRRNRALLWFTWHYGIPSYTQGRWDNKNMDQWIANSEQIYYVFYKMIYFLRFHKGKKTIKILGDVIDEYNFEKLRRGSKWQEVEKLAEETIKVMEEKNNKLYLHLMSLPLFSDIMVEKSATEESTK